MDRCSTARIAAEGSRLSRLIAGDTPTPEIIKEFYIAALSRYPTAEEMQTWKERLGELSTETDQADFLEDFVWGLLTCSEFVTNH